MPIRPECKIAIRKIREDQGNVGKKSHPTQPRLSACWCYLHAALIGEQEIRKIHPGDGTQSVETPNSGIHIEQLVLAVAGILFELNFHDSVEIDSPQESLR